MMTSRPLLFYVPDSPPLPSPTYSPLLERTIDCTAEDAGVVWYCYLNWPCLSLECYLPSWKPAGYRPPPSLLPSLLAILR